MSRQGSCQLLVSASVTLDFYLPDNRLEELQEKYNQEAEERKRLETELKILQVKVSTFSVTYYSPFAFVSLRLLKLTSSMPSVLAAESVLVQHQPQGHRCAAGWILHISVAAAGTSPRPPELRCDGDAS